MKKKDTSEKTGQQKKEDSLVEEALKLEHQLCFPLYAAARKVTGLYTPFLKPLRLTYTQYLVFLVLWERDGLSVSEIGKKLKLDNGTLTPLLKKMEELGHLVRRRSREDERSVIVSLTEQGRELKEKVREIPAKVGNCVQLSEKEAGQLYHLLYQILET